MKIVRSVLNWFLRLYRRLKFLFFPPVHFTCESFSPLCNTRSTELSPRLFAKPLRVLVLYSHEVPFHVLMLGALNDYVRQNTLKNEFFLKIVDVDTFFDDQLRLAVLNIRDNRIDVTLSIGFMLSSYLINVLREGGGTPSIVLGMRAPHAIGLTNRGKLNLTGVIRQPDADIAFAEYLALLVQYVPVVLIPYWPLGDGDYLPVKVANISQYLSAQGMRVIAKPVNTVDELMQCLRLHMDYVKAVVFLEGCLASEALVLARDLCWKHKVLLCFTESLYAVKYGVPLVYGSDLSNFAREAFCLMRIHRTNSLMLGDLPLIRIPNDRELVINEPYFLQLGFPREALNNLRKKDKVRIIRRCAQE